MEHDIEVPTDWTGILSGFRKLGEDRARFWRTWILVAIVSLGLGGGALLVLESYQSVAGKLGKDDPTGWMAKSAAAAEGLSGSEYWIVFASLSALGSWFAAAYFVVYGRRKANASITRVADSLKGLFKIEVDAREAAKQESATNWDRAEELRKEYVALLDEHSSLLDRFKRQSETLRETVAELNVKEFVNVAPFTTPSVLRFRAHRQAHAELQCMLLEVGGLDSFMDSVAKRHAGRLIQFANAAFADELLGEFQRAASPVGAKNERERYHRVVVAAETALARFSEAYLSPGYSPRTGSWFFAS